jgi:hypothetical protein
MRVKSIIKDDETYKKAVIFVDTHQAFFFLYDSLEDTQCVEDYWFESLEEARDWGHTNFGIKEEDWTVIDDPLPGAQHDREKPVKAIKLGNEILIVPYEQ